MPAESSGARLARGSTGAVDQRTQTRPVERWARIGLASRRDVAVANGFADGIAVLQRDGESHKAPVLPGGIGLGVGALELDPDREIVTALPPSPTRHAGVPCAPLAWHKLDDLAGASDEEVRRHPQPLERVVVRMRGAVERVREEVDHVIPAERAWGQTDVVNDEERDLGPGRTVVAVRRRDKTGPDEQSRGVDRHRPPAARGSAPERAPLHPAGGPRHAP